MNADDRRPWPSSEGAFAGWSLIGTCREPSP
jgi:hypothetical protein